ncbi:MAG: hypothetical protein H0U27_13045 [Nitrosopumilus sp.]|nr:hypothetical protein [Nitrosopumilus sp.]
MVTGGAIENLLVNDELKEHYDFDNDNILTHFGFEKIMSDIKSRAM